MRKLLIALMALGAFGLTTVVISADAHAQDGTPKKKKAKKKSHTSKRKRKHIRRNKSDAAAVNEPHVRLPDTAERIAPTAPVINKSSTANSIGADPVAAPASETPAHPVHRL